MTKEDSEGFPFNPLQIPNVALTLALEVLEQEVHSLPPAKSFRGAGIYLLYYNGNFPLYAQISQLNKTDNPVAPIYVGKAVRKGSRKGVDFKPSSQPAVYSRIGNHAKSIEKAENLSIQDFRCRYLVVEDAFISLAESVLISVFRPLWNQVVNGFGNNPTGGPRSRQAKSDWDLLHPGRTRGQGEPQKTMATISEEIRLHLQENDSASMDKELVRIRNRIKKYSLG